MFLEICIIAFVQIYASKHALSMRVRDHAHMFFKKTLFFILYTFLDQCKMKPQLVLIYPCFHSYSFCPQFHNSKSNMTQCKTIYFLIKNPIMATSQVFHMVDHFGHLCGRDNPKSAGERAHHSSYNWIRTRTCCV